MQTHCLAYGNAFAYIVRDNYALPVELLILDPTATYVDTSTGLPIIKTTLNNQPFALLPEDCLHIQNLGDGIQGYNTLHLGRDTLGLGLALQKHGAYYFKNNAQPKLIVELPPTIKGLEKVQEFRNAWYRAHASVDNAFKPAFVPQGTKTTSVSINNDEGQFNQSREFDLLASANLFGASHAKLGSKQNTSYGSLEQDDKNFLADCVEHHLVNWEQEAEAKLLSEQEKTGQLRYIEFERKKLISTDIKTEIELLGYQYQNGMISWEEMRQKMNMTTEKDEDQTWQHPSNIVIEGEEPPAPPPMAAPQPPEAQPQGEDGEEEPAPAEDVARKLTTNTVARLLTRISKAVSEGQTDLAKHHDVMVDNLAVFRRGKEIAEKLLATMQQELDHVLPEQRQAVLDRYTTQAIVEELWK
jgi:HK97 family phage portal protein